MNCQEFEGHLHPYVDGELGVDAAFAAHVHTVDCPGCRSLAERERRFRQLLRRQPRESAPPEFRARILALCRREGRRSLIRPWLAAPALAVAAALVVALALPGLLRTEPLVTDLVDKHITFSQIEGPAEFLSADREDVKQWFLRRAGLRVTVPDYSRNGIRLVGARLAEAGERRAAYVLYEKGHVLMSVFMVSGSGRGAGLPGKPTSYRGSEYLLQERKGYRTVSWAEGQAVFSLVSMLDYEELLECADKLRAERASQIKL